MPAKLPSAILRTTCLVAGLTLLALSGTRVSAQQDGRALIDRELFGALDFRSRSFEACADRPVCVVGNVTVTAERQTEDGASWTPARLYWDPVDGLGITDGAQNDEVDIDERLSIRFAAPVRIRKIWLSDLFLGEEKRYGAAGNDRVEGVPDDVEVAGIALASEGREILNFTVKGEVELPDHQFNQNVSTLFLEDGDLRRRLLIDNDVITVIADGTGAGGAALSLRIPLGQVDADKRGVFEGVETVEIDLSTILSGFRNARMFLAGTQNFDLLKALSFDPDGLAELRETAIRQRAAGDWSNGELGVELSDKFEVDTVRFFAPFDSSNDFSVAGIIVEGGTPGVAN
ncbi:hypothetical protein RGUI_3100 [Rhodovulum sp. P5]|uniref:hypothetical protein n=1 Tax=Rhodovulum sp. P5 TaxID=1564506 RepID=UPI0009C255E8|nr:hypothetical protein [Rhodovulum sp. P5]ARE41241.1 hypothetical protein RGUI_3100 [Rhodovulum sp. P5]